MGDTEAIAVGFPMFPIKSFTVPLFQVNYLHDCKGICGLVISTMLFDGAAVAAGL